MSKFRYIVCPHQYGVDEDTLKLVDNAARRVAVKLKALNVDDLNISDYNKHYLRGYVVAAGFYISQYTQLFLNLLAHSHTPYNKSTIVDYGGGSGILSALASEIGFGNIIYNDIYNQSVIDARVIADSLGSNISHYVCGDIEELTGYAEANNLTIDYVCSFDVLEHIYNWQSWFKTAVKLKEKPLFVFKTSANGTNPLIRRRLSEIHNMAEYQGRVKGEGWKDRDAAEPFFNIRREIITNHNKTLQSGILDKLATSTRGLIKADIKKAVDEFVANGEIQNSIKHPSNTCDPYTGNWPENDIDTNELVSCLTDMGFRAEVINGFYSNSSSRIKTLPKVILNVIICLSGRRRLCFSPTYTLIAK